MKPARPARKPLKKAATVTPVKRSAAPVRTLNFVLRPRYAAVETLGRTAHRTELADFY